MNAIGVLPLDWREAIGAAASDNRLAHLDAVVSERRARGDVYPSAEDVFAAFRLTPYASVKAVILGQDPYHGPGQAHGLAFSVPTGKQIPPSLRNIRAELMDDIGVPIPASGSLVRWAEHGVLLLNTILTVDRGSAGSHKSIGWQDLTTAAILAIVRLQRPVAFLLWGKFASNAAGAVHSARAVVLTTSHPSPFSARKGFRHSRPFSTANRLLRERR